MALEQKLNLRLSQRLVMTPSLQQAIKLLQMSRLELQEVLTQEMVENPVLEEQEEDEPRPSGRRGRPRDRGRPAAADAAAPAEKERDSFEEIDFDSYFEDYLDSAYNPRQYQEQPEEFSLENILTAARGPAGTPDLAALDVEARPERPRDRDLLDRQHRRGRLPAGLARGDPAGAYDNEADVEAALAPRALLRSARASAPSTCPTACCSS